MENLERLLALYRDDEKTQQLVKDLQETTPARIHLEGMVGAQESFVLTGNLP